MWPGVVPNKTLNYDGKLMRKGVVLRSKKEIFALYVLQLKRLRWIKDFEGKWSSGKHPKTTKIDALGELGYFFEKIIVWGKIDFCMAFSSAKRQAKITKIIIRATWCARKHYLGCHLKSSLGPYTGRFWETLPSWVPVFGADSRRLEQIWFGVCFGLLALWPWGKDASAT